jgi:hypothetical protein
MHLRTLSKDALKETLLQACFAPSQEARRQMMIALDQLQRVPGYIWMLVRVVNIDDLGVDVPLQCRQLAAILLKTFTLKHWQQRSELDCLLNPKEDCDGEMEDEEDEEVLSDAERDAVRHFLLTYLHEPDSQIALQLSVLTSGLAKSDYPTHWPNLISVLIAQIDSQSQTNKTADSETDRYTHQLSCFRASVYLRDALVSMSTTDGFAPNLMDICLNYFPYIARSWALNSRQIQTHLSSLLSQLHENTSLRRQYAFELQGHHTVVLMEVLKIFLEVSLPQIVDKFPCFNNFWKTYLTSIQLFCGFIKKTRPLCRLLALHKKPVSSSNTPSSSVLAGRERGRERSIADALHNQAFILFDASNDYFIPFEYCAQYEHEGLFVSVNTVLLLLRCQNCTPIILQKKFPLHVVNWLEALLGFYVKHLIDEDQERGQSISFSVVACVLVV